jgi:hypothetical protein
LKKRLTDELVKQAEECALPELAANPDSDLWSTPTVDSKTVVKLSPVVKEMTGFRLDPKWIRKGGYASIPEAVADVMARLAEHCVGLPAEEKPAPAKQPEPAHA